MKRENPFSVIVRLRSLDERRRRVDLATARAVHDKARERLEEMKAKYREELSLDEILTPVELRSLQLRGLGSYELLVIAAEEHERTRQQLERRADAWRKSANDLDAAERLDGRRREDLARHARTAAERSLDDLMVVLRRSEGLSR